MISLLTKNDPRRVYDDLLENNEEFRSFIERNKNKTTEEMINTYSLNTKIREQ